MNVHGAEFARFAGGMNAGMDRSLTVEIEGMRRRLALLRGAPAAREAEFPELGGTRGPAPTR